MIASRSALAKSGETGRWVVGQLGTASPIQLVALTTLQDGLRADSLDRSFGTPAERPAFIAPDAVGLTSIRRWLRRPVVGRAGPTKPATGADYEILGEALAKTAQKSDHPCEVRTASSAGEIYTVE